MRCRAFHRFTVATIALALVATACSSGGNESGAVDTSDDNAVDRAGWLSIGSDDGRATLGFDPASLPDDVSPDDLRIESVFDPDAEPGSPIAAVGMTPHGTEFSSPAELRISVGDRMGSLLTVMHRAGDFVDFVDASADQGADGGVELTVDIDHFSAIVVRQIPGEAEIAASPGTVQVDGEQEMDLTINVGDAVPVALALLADPVGMARPITLGVSTPLDLQGSGTATWLTSFAPGSVPFEFILGDRSAASVGARSTCVDPVDDEFIVVKSKGSISTTVASIGPLTSVDEIAIAANLTGTKAPTGVTWNNIEAFGVGDEVTLSFTHMDLVKTVCVAAPPTSDSQPLSPTPTTPNSNPATTATGATYDEASQRFVVTFGEGARAFATDPSTKWFNVRITVTTPNGTYTLDGKYARGENDGTRLLGEFMAPLDSDAVISNSGFADGTNYEIDADGLPDGGAVTSATVSVVARVENADGTNTDYESGLTFP